ncbi:hypothetical protein [Streptomyces sp. NBC_00829]|uniref:hypothetical protein n=1 Tax=Streptomyces sp. NBC_00829 TaxID=2903679 RepID=UPI003863157F|nr:hypothetical protein OG293_24265 [Streptomyces sp. NBC_00829]
MTQPTRLAQHRFPVLRCGRAADQGAPGVSPGPAHGLAGGIECGAGGPARLDGGLLRR